MSTKWKSTSVAGGGIAAISLAMLPLLTTPATQGCSDDPTSALCCKDFQVGADLSDVDFGVDASIEGEYRAFAQGVSDISATATAAVNDVITACSSMAIELGADPDDASVQGKSGRGLATAWCALAKAQIEGNAALEAAGELDVEFAPPQCEASVDAQVDCQAGCAVEGGCEGGRASATCEGGEPPSFQCSGECTGTCRGSFSARVDCTGSCDAMCRGTCTASGDASVNCQGTCNGTCNGACNVNGTITEVSGVCNGVCEGTCSGTCEIAATAEVQCDGTCEGTCSGGCDASAGGDLTCEGRCEAGCEVGTGTAPKCDGEITLPDCEVDAECKASCDASVEAKADCQPPQLTIRASGYAALDADARKDFELAVNTLKLHMPKILVVLQGRGEAFVNGIDALVSAGRSITANADGLGVKGAACGVTMASTVGEAAANAEAAVSASAEVAGSVGIGN